MKPEYILHQVRRYRRIFRSASDDNPGLKLFHCHQQLHMDFGFMALFKYA
jgi:FtsP/CotA-like multicopper oxidase with cupredoxin domain